MLAAAVLVAVGAMWLLRHIPGPASRRAAEGNGAVGNVEPTSTVPASPASIELGKATFEKQCIACHGREGKGDGEAAYLLYPKPRDFVAANYRLVSTWEHVPTDQDLFRTISRGMPGSAMPSWAHLPEQTRWGLVHYVKSLAAQPMQIGAPSAAEPEHGVVSVPPEPPDSAQARNRAIELYKKGCAPCHGESGKGDGAQKQVDNEGFATRPRDLTAGVFKGPPQVEHVYRRIVLGLPGTPMPSSSYLQGDDAWALVHYIMSLSSEKQRERVEMKQFHIAARRIQELPTHPDDGAWQKAPRVNLHLMPLWWRLQRPEELTVQALHDGTDIALLLTWADDTHDHTAMRPQDFRDAAAIEFSLTPDPPFFAMGQAHEFVNIWMWKSERQADLEPAFQDLEKVYPNLGIDSYPNPKRSALEQPTRHALTLQSDPTFVTGWGAGNIVSDPTRASASEDLAAQGFGTLSARPKIEQRIDARGVYTTGTYRVVFHRSLEARGEHSVALRPGDSTPVSFAVWNGSAGDRDGKKSVTIWQILELDP
ncbi:MAG: ethylbenzene dehydrogenase-related protein [Planctomycetota bacterium]